MLATRVVAHRRGGKHGQEDRARRVRPHRDNDRAEKFWEGFGGWEIKDCRGWRAIDYRMFQDEGWGGAVYKQQEGEQGPIVFFDTDDIDADLAKVRELGGNPEEIAADPARRLVRALQGHRREPLQPLSDGRVESRRRSRQSDIGSRRRLTASAACA